jgi:hypothetical protein
MKPGRKPKPPGEKQDRKIMTTFTDAEYRALEQAAGEEPLGTWIRKLVLRALARRERGSR